MHFDLEKHRDDDGWMLILFIASFFFEPEMWMLDLCLFLLDTLIDLICIENLCCKRNSLEI
jgi:hypothetical protein